MVKCILWIPILLVTLFVTVSVSAQQISVSPTNADGGYEVCQSSAPDGFEPAERFAPGRYEEAMAGPFAPRQTQSLSWRSVRERLDGLEAHLEIQIQRCQAARRERDRVEELIAIGVAEAGQLPPLEIAVLESEVRLRAAMSMLERVKTLVSLAQPMDIDLKNASISQAATAISRAAGGAPIEVSAEVPEYLKVTAQARGIPLGTVLETIAKSAGLIIARGDNDQFVFAPKRIIEINGEGLSYHEANSPWGDEWGVPGPLGPATPGRVWMRLLDAALPSALPGLGPAPSYMPQPPGDSLAMAVGPEQLVVAEPGSGPGGEVGFWLTLYRIDPAGSMHEASRVFHHSATAPEPQPGPPGRG